MPPDKEVTIMDKSIKTWRVFLFGMCCILVSLYIKKILLSLEIIKGDFLSNSIVGVAVIWFIAGIFRLYHLKRTYPELKTVLSKDKWCIAESILIFILAVGLTLTGVGAHNTQMLSEIFQRDEDENITESIVNTEYGSIEDFSANNSMDIFVLNFNKESNLDNGSFSAVDKTVSVAKSYTAVTYECEIDSDRFQVKLATYDSDNGEEQLNAVIKSNPDIFTKKDIGGNSTYYCPGSKYDWSDCYAMVVDHKLLVVNIEKEYDQYIEWVLGNITLQ